jgi:hypothetical protein
VMRVESTRDIGRAGAVELLASGPESGKEEMTSGEESLDFLEGG